MSALLLARISLQLVHGQLSGLACGPQVSEHQELLALRRVTVHGHHDGVVKQFAHAIHLSQRTRAAGALESARDEVVNLGVLNGLLKIRPRAFTIVELENERVHLAQLLQVLRHLLRVCVESREAIQMGHGLRASLLDGGLQLSELFLLSVALLLLFLLGLLRDGASLLWRATQLNLYRDLLVRLELSSLRRRKDRFLRWTFDGSSDGAPVLARRRLLRGRLPANTHLRRDLVRSSLLFLLLRLRIATITAYLHVALLVFLNFLSEVLQFQQFLFQLDLDKHRLLEAVERLDRERSLEYAALGADVDDQVVVVEVLDGRLELGKGALLLDQ